jgi:hypothetical protein
MLLEVPAPPLMPVVPPAAPVAVPLRWMQRSRSRPTSPTHWLGSGALAPALELVLPPSVELELPPSEVLELPPMLEPVLGLVVVPGLVVLVPALAPVFAPAEPDVLVCAQEMPATPTNAAATAAAIALVITMEPPES